MDKGKKEFIISKLSLQEMLKEYFRQKECYQTETWIYTRKKNVGNGKNDSKYTIYFSYFDNTKR